MKNFIVGDAGGTSTDWRVVKAGQIDQFKTIGFNRYTHQIENLAGELEKVISKDLQAIEHVFLYVAGVETNEHKKEIQEGLAHIFPSHLEIENDLLGVCRSLCGDSEGVIGILGTGSNACKYDGNQVDKVSASLGYVLGDEGSGADMGKRLLKRVFRKQLDKALIQSFQNQYNLTSQMVLEILYNKPYPNQYLASFASFIASNKAHPDIHALICESFKSYFEAFFPNGSTEPFNFAGSIAYYFSDHLRSVASELGYSIAKTVESPIAGLVLYHQNHEE